MNTEALIAWIEEHDKIKEMEERWQQKRMGPELAKKQVSTPGYLKRIRMPKYFCSPTDNVLSPITKNLMRPGANPVAVAAAGAVHEAAAEVLDFNLKDDDEDECIERGDEQDGSEVINEQNWIPQL